MLARLFPNVYEGWLVVGASAFIVTMIGATFFYGFGTVFNPIRSEFGWSAAATSFAFSLRQETSGIAAPLVGLVIDRIGPRRVMAFGIVVVSIGVVLMSAMQNLWQFYATMVVIAIGTTACGGQVGLVATATWFQQRRARAMSFMTLGGGIAGMFVVLVAALVEAVGWREALRVMGGVILVLGLAGAVNVRSRPLRHHQPMDGIRRAGYGAGDDDIVDWGIPLRQAVFSRAYLLIAFALVMNSFATTSLIVHQIPFMESIGVSTALAGTTVGIFSVSSIVGRLGLGYAADKYDKRLVLVSGIGLAVLAMPLLALAQNLWQAILVLLLIAPGFGGAIPVRPALLADYFGTKYFGTLNGITMLAMTFGGFGGPLLLGWLVDETGGYGTGWVVCGLVGALAIPAVIAARPPRALAERYRRAALHPPGADAAGD